MYLLFSEILGIDVTNTMSNVVVDGLVDLMFSSELHIPVSGVTNESRISSNATAAGLSNEAGFWVNTPSLAENHAQARRIHIVAKSNQFSTGSVARARGYAVRCIRDTPLETVSLD